MEAHCTECGTMYEVGESQKNAQMFCLKCDNFFKIEERTESFQKDVDTSAAFNESIKSSYETEKCSFNKKLGIAFKKLFARKKKIIESEPEIVLEADPPKMSEAAIAAATKRFALIDDFLEPEMDFENEPEDVPLEYIDFLSVGLDVYSSDLIENHGKNKPDVQPSQKV